MNSKSFINFSAIYTIIIVFTLLFTIDINIFINDTIKAQQVQAPYKSGYDLDKRKSSSFSNLDFFKPNKFLYYSILTNVDENKPFSYYKIDDEAKDDTQMINDLKASPKIVEFIINYEGNAGLYPPLKGLDGDTYGLYNDEQGNCTVGIGHLVHMGNCNTKDIVEHKKNYPNGETKIDALKVLKNDLVFIENDVKENVNAPLLQNQFDALIDFVFNEGVENFKSSKLLKDVNEGIFNVSAIKNDFLQFTRDGLLLDRRNDEANIFNYNVYTGV
ncbi:MAG: lysozyme [Candidatus Nitrosocosmicus sp.]